MKKKVSIVIPTYNGSSRIQAVINAILSQKNIDLKYFEIIVVDNNSTDNTATIVRQMALNNDNLKLISENQQGRIFALLSGMKAASNEIICNIDDDNLISENYLHNLLGLFASNDSLIACGGRGEAIFEEHSTVPNWFFDNSLSYAVGRPNISSGYIDKRVGWLYGAGFSYKKDSLEKLLNGGFKFSLTGRSAGVLLSGEDTELLLALMLLGGDVYYDEKLVFKHYIPNIRLNKEYLIKLNFGFGLASPVVGLYRANLLPSSLYNILRKNYFIYILVQFLKYAKNLLKYRRNLNWRIRQEQIIGSLYSSIKQKDLWDLAKKNIEIIKSLGNK